MSTPIPPALLEAMADAISYEANPEDLIMQCLAAAEWAGYVLVEGALVSDSADALEGWYDADPSADDSGYAKCASLAARLRQAAGGGA